MTRRARGGVVATLIAVAVFAAGCGFGGGSDKSTGAGGRPVVQLIVLKPGTGDLEVLLTRLGPKTLTPGAWALPSGTAEPSEAGKQAAVADALGYLAAQTGIKVTAGDLVAYAEWLVPGFDSTFYLALAPDGATPRVKGSNIVNVGWFEPLQALHLRDAGKLPMGYGTGKQLESLTRFTSSEDAVHTTRTEGPTTVHLQIVGQGDKRRAVLPEDAPGG